MYNTEARYYEVMDKAIRTKTVENSWRGIIFDGSLKGDLCVITANSSTIAYKPPQMLANIKKSFTIGLSGKFATITSRATP